jgi:signal transduction histidine kinase
MNLMLNAIEAMQDTGGELTVASKKCEDGQIGISVSDSGVGVAQIVEHRAGIGMSWLDVLHGNYIDKEDPD